MIFDLINVDLGQPFFQVVPKISVRNHIVNGYSKGLRIYFLEVGCKV